MLVYIMETISQVLVFGLLGLPWHFASSAPHFEGKNCPLTGSYGLNSTFQSNLNYTLFTQLPAKASVVGFSNFTEGTGDDRVYALYYCRGDINVQDCHDCVQAAALKIVSVCELSKEATVWFDKCTLRYANRTIFSLLEESSPIFHFNNTSTVSEYHMEPHKQLYDSMMEDLIQQAASNNGSLRGFATKEVNLLSSEVLRGLVQCSPDIVGPRCDKCLRSALKQGDQWAMTATYLPSCMIRYDLYGSTETPPPPSPSGSLPVRYIVVIVVLVFISLAVIVGYWLWNRQSQVSDEDEPNSENPPLTTENPPVVHALLPKFTFYQLVQMTRNFEKEIGKGACGVVYSGCLSDGRKVAVKVLNEKDAPTQFSNEINVFGRISHKNLVSLLGYCEETKLALIYEFMNKGDLKALLSDDADCLSWRKRLEIAIDTAEGLRYLHDNCNPPIMHRDVKPANILLNEKLKAKVADFGYSKIFPEEDVTTLLSRVIGTVGYTDPEYSATGMLNDKVDVYSFGVVLLELITGRAPAPFRGFYLVKWVEEMLNTGDIEMILDPRLTNDANYNSVWKATELATSCVSRDTQTRPAMWKIVAELKECVDMEIKKDTTSSGKGTIVLDTVTADPEAR